MPGLQPEVELGRQAHWSPAARLLAGPPGATLAAFGLGRGGLSGAALGAAGLELLAPAATNRTFREPARAELGWQRGRRAGRTVDAGSESVGW